MTDFIGIEVRDEWRGGEILTGPNDGAIELRRGRETLYRERDRQRWKCAVRVVEKIFRKDTEIKFKIDGGTVVTRR
jgi:hypothetical protein